MTFHHMHFPLVKSLLVFGILTRSSCHEAALAQSPPPSVTQRQRPTQLPPAAPIQPGISYFRSLIAASQEERKKLLEGKSEAHRLVLESSLQSYLALSPEERELRLRTMELRYHLTTLLRTSPGQREEKFKLVPERDRPLIEDRLKYWDTLSPAEQSDALENERIIRITGFVNSSTTRGGSLDGQTSNQVRQIETQLTRWQTLPEERRAQIQRNFTKLFELSDVEKTREQLQPLQLSPLEQALMQSTIEKFKKLSPSQRDLCIRNFDKFAALSAAERRQFLINAEEWQRMKPEDRVAWRKIVSKVPPLPPGLGLPPLPRPSRPVVQKIEVTTNGAEDKISGQR